MYQRLTHPRPLLLAYAVGLACCSLSARAQETPAPALADDGAPSVVTVTGIRRAYLKAIDSKLDRAGTADVVSANEVQGLPDTTTVETLRRVPGLSVLPALDNEHPRDEAATPVLRGLGAAYNNVTIDGSPLASPGTPNGTLGSIGRGVRLDILPSSMISELVVAKTFTADMEPNAIGGAIDLRTRSAFERGGRPFFTIEGAAGAASDTGKPNPQHRVGPRVITTGSLTFGPERRYGVVVSANYQKLDTTTNTHMTTDTVYENYYDNNGVRQSGAALGNGYAVPQQDKYWYVQNRRSRFGLTVKGEARPVDDVSAFATVGWYTFRDHMMRNENLIDPRATATNVLQQTPTSGRFAGGAVEVGYSDQDMTSTTRLLQTGADWRIDERQSLGLRANVSRATYDEPIWMIKYMTNPQYAVPGKAGATSITSPEYAFDYDAGGLNHSFNVSPAAWNNLANYRLYYYRPDNKRTAADTIGNLRADYRNNLGRPGLGFAAGASYTLDQPRYAIVRNDLEPNNSGQALTLASVLGPGAPLMYNQNNLPLLTIDPSKSLPQIAALRAAGGLNTTDQSNFSNQDNFEHKERTIGAYIQGSYTTDKLKTQFGLREDNTRQETTGRALVAGTWQKLPTHSSYRFLLPSAVATYQATEDFDVRVGASRTIGRPTYDSYAARTSINFVNQADLGNANATGVTVTVGNPDIKPRRSTNLDLALDYSLPRSVGGLLSLAVFDKRIKDEIFNSSSLGYAYQGVNYASALVTSPQNSSNAAVRGVEASAIVNSLVWMHPVLRDIGFSANWTGFDSHLEVLKSDKTTRTLDRLVGQPDQTANLTVFYTHDGLELRAAWNRQGKALRSITPNIAWQDLYWAARSQVDLQASYRFAPGLVAFAQVQNASGARLTSVTGPAQNLLKDTYSVPRTVWLGLRYTPGNR